MNTVKHISAILTCSVLGCILLKMVEGIGHRLNPGISQLEKSDLNKVAEYIASIPPLTIGIILFAYLIGTVTAAFLAVYMTKIWELGDWRRNGVLAGLLIMAYVVVSMLMMPHPSIMNIAGPIACIVGTLVGIKLGETFGGVKI